MVEAISPDEIGAEKAKVIPAFVLESVNELIAARFTNGRARILQEDIIYRIIEKSPDTTRGDIFNKGWLNFEEVYRGKGWKVIYDRPAYFEDYEASFAFTVK